ncbi:uncharacterized protein LOC114763156 [Neltuma alba]|uniref:uncharacterized protein LOC114763156 n=1 Tax=Neltuma alba TaxID=207710 RepID=UPI0010A49FB9|nr:uncharacterized protein LOC114763156 [Prosopis alba]
MAIGESHIHYYLDAILIPASVFLIAGYHGYLYHYIKNKPSITTYGIKRLSRSAWFLHLNQGNKEKGMLVVQSLRNTLMSTIFAATITILINFAFAAITSAGYTASHGHNHRHLFTGALMGSKSDQIYSFKYASASFFVLISFVCNSMAIGFLIDANFLMNSCGDFLSENGYAERVLERGFALGLIANRVLCFSVPLVLWMFGPIALALSSLVLICVFHQNDFVPKFPCNNAHKR